MKKAAITLAFISLCTIAMAQYDNSEKLSILAGFTSTDPYERAQYESGAWETFAIDQMWLFVPLQQSIKDFLVTIPQYPFQMGSSLTVSGINYDLFRKADAMQQLENLKKELDTFGSSGSN